VTHAGRQTALVAGHIWRPGAAVALGLSGIASLQSRAKVGLADAGWRPFGRPWLTLHGYYGLHRGERAADGFWGAGAVLEPLPGLQLGATYRHRGGEDGVVDLAVGITLGRQGLTVLPRVESGGISRTAWLWRGDSPERRLPDTALPRALRPTRRVVTLDLQHRLLTYQRYRWFDDRRVAWLDLSRVLDAVAADPAVVGVVLNLSDFHARPSLSWELRRRLADLRRDGKLVAVQLDRAGMLLYDLATVADRVSLDPQGDLTLPGFDLSRTYLRSLLDRLGLGFQALQYFPHKTAVEVLSRDDMSPADREQRQRVLDVIYAQVREDAATGRGFAPASFDSVVDEEVMVLPERALALGLVDTLARWDDLVTWAERRCRAARSGPPRPGDGPDRDAPNGRWGPRPRVAVVYAVGECAMDSGIRGRRLAAHLRALRRDPLVRAVVLRVDSPGGDPLPSELVAAAVRELRRAGKPVVVSQGDVAASGGYWLSMDADEVLTTPWTVTGSIGVISGWLWDRELHEKAGVHADGVSRGRHADLFRTVRYPVGVDIPARPLNEAELSKARERILALYDGFVDHVAQGRSLPPDSVRAIGGGRVWMGPDAVRLGLCDRLGGLDDAVDRARALAGLPAAVPAVVTEYPPRPLVELPRLGLPLPGARLAVPLPSLPGLTAPRPATAADAGAAVDPAARLLALLAEWRGRAWTWLPPGALPDAWRRWALAP